MPVASGLLYQNRIYNPVLGNVIKGTGGFQQLIKNFSEVCLSRNNLHTAMMLRMRFQ